MHRTIRDTSVSTGSAAPLSAMQWGIWLGEQRTNAAPGFHMAFTFAFERPIAPLLFQSAFQALLDRCDALQTVIELENGAPRQRVCDPFPYQVEFIEMPGYDSGGSEWVQDRIRRPLRLDERLFDSALIKPSARRFIWYLNIHHIIADGWSYARIFEVMSEFYGRAREGTLDSAPSIPSYSYPAESVPASSHEVKTGSPEDPPRGVLSGTAGDRERRIRVELEPERMVRLDAFAGGSAFHLDLARIKIFTAALALWMHQTTRRRRIVVGIPFHGRTDEKSRPAVGLLQRTVPVCIEIEGDATVSGLLRQVEGALWRAMQKGDGNRHLLAEASEVMINYPNVSFAEFDGAAVRADWVHPGYGDGARKLFLQIHDFNRSGALTLDFDANEGCFSELAHRRTAEHVLYLLDCILSDSDQRIAGLDRMTPALRRTVVRQFNDTDRPFPSEKTLADLFEDSAARFPASTAIECASERLDYAGLNAAANRLAHRLIAAGVGPSVPVAICAEPSIVQLVAMLAIFKAGGVYLPLDPAYPPDRLRYMLSNARATVLLTAAARLSFLPGAGVDVMPLDELLEPSYPDTNPARSHTAASDPAYLIFTSGSTGTPKGVAMPQRAMTNLITWQMTDGTRLPLPRTLQFTPLSFDVSIQEVFSTWCAGGTLVVPGVSVRRDPEATLRILLEERIEQLYIIYTPLRRLAEVAVRLDRYPAALREVITAGEQVHITPAIREFFNRIPDCSFQNQYGPSETHIVTRFTPAGPPDSWSALPSIGKPIANTQIYLLDDVGRPVPPGEEGEIYIGGVQVADGYLYRPDFTAERFVPDPYRAAPGARMYRTGDLGRYDEEGNIEFLGRVDHQVKVRGYRIEPGEVEAALEGHPGIRECVVVTRGDDDKRLVAYFVSKMGDAPSTSELRLFLDRKLPVYMIPSAFVKIDAMPHTPNGKVDRKALPEPKGRPDVEAAFIAPESGTEQFIATVWCDVLRLDRIGRNDNFFELGGDSLMIVDVHTRLCDRLTDPITVIDLFQYPTISSLAEFLRAGSKKSDLKTRARERAESQKRAARRRRKGVSEQNIEEGQRNAPDQGEDP